VKKSYSKSAIIASFSCGFFIILCVWHLGWSKVSFYSKTRATVYHQTRFFGYDFYDSVEVDSLGKLINECKLEVEDVRVEYAYTRHFPPKRVEIDDISNIRLDSQLVSDLIEVLNLAETERCDLLREYVEAMRSEKGVAELIARLKQSAGIK
jgi:hypothetical protein